MKSECYSSTARRCLQQLAGQEPSQLVAVGAHDDGHVGLGQGPGLGPDAHGVGGQPSGEHLLGGGQAADGDGGDPVGVVAGGLAVDVRVVLAVVAEEDPGDLGQVDHEPAQLGALVLDARAEPAGVGRPPVGHERGPRGEAVAGEEGAQGGDHVPGAGGQVHHRGARVGGLDARVELGHPGDGLARRGVLDELVPGGHEYAGDVRDHGGVVDVGDDAQARPLGDDEDLGGDRLRPRRLDPGLVPAGLQAVVAHDDVDVAAAVGPGAHAGPAHVDRHRQEGHRHLDEQAPAALGVEQPGHGEAAGLGGGDGKSIGQGAEQWPLGRGVLGAHHHAGQDPGHGGGPGGGAGGGPTGR